MKRNIIDEHLQM